MTPAVNAPVGSLGAPAPRTVPSIAVSAYLLSRSATFITAAGIALISGRSIGGVLSLWDGGWYLSIVRDGYPSFVLPGVGVASQSSIAFFPGYPLLVRTLSEHLGISPVFAGCSVSLLAGLGATAALWHLAVRLSDEETADKTVVLFAFLPSAFVMSMVYADALFLVLAVCCLIALIDERWLTAGGTAAAAGLVRPTAVALTIACAWAAIVAVRRTGRWRAMIAPAIAPAGALLYLGYIWIHTGDAFAFFEVQNRGWGNRIDIGAANVRAVLRHFGERRSTFFVAMIAIVVGGLGVGFWFLVCWRTPGFIIAYVSIVIGLSFLGSNPMSIPRFLLAAFPLLIPIARRLSARSTLALAATCGALMGTLFFVIGLSPTLSP